MLELNKIYCWDCLELMKQIPDKSIDLVLTDPPYWINAGKWVSWWFGSSKTDKHYEDDWDKFTSSQEYFDEILRIGKSVVIFGWQFFTDKLPVNWHWIVWDKVWEIQFENPFGKCELAWTNIDKKSVNKYVVIQQWFVSDEKQRRHPTQKPVTLFKKIIVDYLDNDDWIVLDCFLWSWTTAVACKELWRNFIGIEKEQKYVDIANKRLEHTTVSLF
jgi:DNA modification methylase